MRCIVLKTITIEGKTAEPGEYKLDTFTKPVQSIGVSPARAIRGHHLIDADRNVLLTLTAAQLADLNHESLELPTEPRSQTQTRWFSSH